MAKAALDDALMPFMLPFLFLPFSCSLQIFFIRSNEFRHALQ